MPSLFGKTFTGAEIRERCGLMDQYGGIRLVELSDGPATGVRAAEIRTGSGLEVLVLLDRAMDLSNGSFKGIPLCWRSATGDVHPAFYEPEGLSWLRTFFGGILATCGLTQAGAPNVDGDTPLGLHGRIGAARAANVCVKQRWVGDDYVMAVKGEVREASVFGPDLVMTRKLSTKLGSSAILIEDAIENRGYQTQPLMLLYHFNIGWPIISEQSRLVLPTKGVTPRDEAAAPHVDRWSHFEVPAADHPEEVFYHDLATDAKGMTVGAILNAELSVGITLRYKPAELPYFNQWKKNEKGTYVCGMEPANCRVKGRAEARAKGELRFIEPGEVRTATVEFGVVEGAAVDAVRAEVTALA